MLSTTNSVADVKVKLVRLFSYYGYADDPAFVVAIGAAIEEAKLMDLIPSIGNTLYNLIQAKDKVSLNDQEMYLYLAEVFFSSSRFLKNVALSREQASAGGSDSLKVEGYERIISGGSVNSGMFKTSEVFWKDGLRCMALAGFQKMMLQRGDTAGTPSTNFRWGR